MKLRYPRALDLDPDIARRLQPGRLSRLAALPVRVIDWLLRKAIR